MSTTAMTTTAMTTTDNKQQATGNRQQTTDREPIASQYENPATD